MNWLKEMRRSCRQGIRRKNKHNSASPGEVHKRGRTSFEDPVWLQERHGAPCPEEDRREHRGERGQAGYEVYGCGDRRAHHDHGTAPHDEAREVVHRGFQGLLKIVKLIVQRLKH